jgi:hypothetical protein
MRNFPWGYEKFIIYKIQALNMSCFRQSIENESKQILQQTFIVSKATDPVVNVNS